MSFDIKFTRQGFKSANNESQSLPSDSTCLREAEVGKLDIKRRKPGAVLISIPIGSLFKMVIMTELLIFMLIYVVEVIQ